MGNVVAVVCAFRYRAAGLFLLSLAVASQARGRAPSILYSSPQRSLVQAGAPPTPVSSTASRAGAHFYQAECAVCHGEDGRGREPSLPSLVGNLDYLRDDEVATIVIHGLRRMPAFPYTSEHDLAALMTYLRNQNAVYVAHQPAVSQQALSTDADGKGEALYAAHCAICHGDDGKGSDPGFPSLLGAGSRWNETRFLEIVRHGEGRMPAFSGRLTEEDFRQVAIFLGVPIREN